MLNVEVEIDGDNEARPRNDGVDVAARVDRVIEALASIGANPGSAGVEVAGNGYTLHLSEQHMNALLRTIEK